jgi:hypothetical protein
MFDNMSRKTPNWNLNGDLLWGYFFFDEDPERLKSVANELVERGYRLVDIHVTDDASTNVLHVEKVETHTVESLHARNLELYALADEFGLESYDGMDVGPAPP